MWTSQEISGKPAKLPVGCGPDVESKIFGLASSSHGMQMDANVAAKLSLNQDLSDTWLSFGVTRDIRAYSEELLWDYHFDAQSDGGDAPPSTTPTG